MSTSRRQPQPVIKLLRIVASMGPMHAESDLQVDAPPRRWLRIAVVTETYPPEINGVAATLSQMVNGLRERGHELQLIRPRQGQDDVAVVESRFAEMLMRGLPIPRYPELRMGLPAKRALLRRWSFDRPDVVHLATEGPLGWSALQAARQLRLPVLSEFRTNFQAYSRHYGVGWLRHPIVAYLRKFHNQCDRTLAPSPDLAASLMAQGFKRVGVVGRGVDTERFHPGARNPVLRAQWGARPDDPVLLCVGRLAPEKNLLLAVEAWERLQRAQPRAKLVFVGDGPQAAALQARCPRAVFAGRQTGEALAAHYASADLFVFPSLTETFGNVVPEAMASGLPVVAFDYAAAAQLLRDRDGHPSAGLHVPLPDREAFCQAVLALGLNPEARRRCRLEALARAQHIAWSGVVDALEAQHTELARPPGFVQAPGTPALA